MTIETTPLRGHERGDGWHLEPRRRWLSRVAVGLVVLVLAGAAVSAVEKGNWLAVGLLAVFVVALASVPLAGRRQRLEPRIVTDAVDGPGLLLPIHGMSRLFTFGCVVLGLLLLLSPVVAFDESDGSTGLRVLATVLALIPAGIGFFFLVAAYGAITGSRRRDKGMLLTPYTLVLQTQAEPMRIPWDAVRGVRPHWTRFRPPGDLMKSAEDPVQNWLSFPADPDRVEGPNPLGLLAKTEDPTVDVDKIATDRVATVLLLRHYLADPTARAELGSASSLEHARRFLADAASGDPS